MGSETPGWPEVVGGIHPAVRAWFDGAFAAPTEPQAAAWPAIARGENTLLLAPTGSGKTLAAFLMAINELCQAASRGELPERVAGPRVLYISPLRALNNDVHRNLEQPLAGIAGAARDMGAALPRLRSAVRTGDTPPDERRWMLREPPHILITTPESFFLMLCSKGREMLRHVRTVIVDETHALFPNKRGTLLSLSLEYLQELVPGPLQRIGLSATQRPLEDIGAFVVGGEAVTAPGEPAGDDRSGLPGSWVRRPLTIIETPGRKELDLAISMPVPDFADLPENTIWPEIHREVYRLACSHSTTLVFVNNRQVGERIAAAVNDLAGEEFCRVHHGSISRELRLETEEMLKAGRLRCLIATSTLELGIDVGAIDLVVQVESPHEVARAIQRVGRAGHVPGLPSKGRIIPKTRHDLLEAAVIAGLMRERWIEPQHSPENALDVLAQFVVGLSIERPRRAVEILDLVRRAFPYRGLSRERFNSVLAMVAGRYATGEAVDLRPLLEWDVAAGVVSAAARGRRLIYTSGGTIPDSGNYPVYLQGQGIRLGELDEEFVHERRIGDRFSLGTSSWRITEIAHDRVQVVPASGGPRVPFWKGEMFGRPYLLGRQVAGFLAEADDALRRERTGGGGAGRPDPLWRTVAERTGLGADAAAALRAYLASQAEATGCLPSDRFMVVEEFRDELSQWRVVVHSPFGRGVNAPLALLLEAQAERDGSRRPEFVVTDDAILFGAGPSELPPQVDLSQLSEIDLPGQLAGAVRRTLLFGRLFREAAGRALVLPRLPFGRRRTPLWLTRRKSAALLQVAENIPDFPIVHEAMREALTSGYDLAGLAEVLRGLGNGTIGIVRVTRNTPSPFARPALFAHVGAFFYADDLPPAERRLRFLGLDRQALADLLGQAQLRELLDPGAIAAVEAEAAPSCLSGSGPLTPAALHDWLMRYGELAEAELPAASRPALAELAASGKAVPIVLPCTAAAGQRWSAAETAADYAALAAGNAGGAGTTLDWPEARAAAARVLRRYSLRHSPFTAADAATYFGLPLEYVESVLRQLEQEGALRGGAFRPGGTERDWSEPELLVEMHRRSLARARQAVEPVSPEAYQAFLADWQGIGRRRSGLAALCEVLGQLEGLPLDAAAWERYVLPGRVSGYEPAQLDQVTGTGQFRWLAGGRLDRLRVSFWRADGLTAVEQEVAGNVPHPVVLPPAETISGTMPADELPALAREILGHLSARGAQFTTDLWRGLRASPGEVLAALEQLLARGMITNDTFGPVRHLLTMPAGDRGLPRTVTAQMLAGAARWTAFEPPARPAEAEASVLLNRYGLLCREVAAAEGVAWSELLPVLVRLELLGKLRRGYFVRGLSGMQFALPQAVERLRAAREAVKVGDLLALADGDPALAWGRILPWPEGLVRPHAPSVLVLRGGAPAMAGEGKPLRIWPMAQAEADARLGMLRQLVDLAGHLGGDRLEVGFYDGEPVRSSQVAGDLAELGFTAAPLTLVRWRLP